VDLVVDDEPPVSLVEQLEVRTNSASFDFRHVSIWYVESVTGRMSFLLSRVLADLSGRASCAR
jgi:hypothetical protein